MQGNAGSTRPLVCDHLEDFSFQPLHQWSYFWHSISVPLGNMFARWENQAFYPNQAFRSLSQQSRLPGLLDLPPPPPGQKEGMTTRRHEAVNDSTAGNFNCFFFRSAVVCGNSPDASEIHRRQKAIPGRIWHFAWSVKWIISLNLNVLHPTQQERIQKRREGSLSKVPLFPRITCISDRQKNFLAQGATH